MLSLPLCTSPHRLDFTQGMFTLTCPQFLVARLFEISLVHFLDFDAWLGRWGVSVCVCVCVCGNGSGSDVLQASLIHRLSILLLSTLLSCTVMHDVTGCVHDLSWTHHAMLCLEFEVLGLF